MTDAPQRQPIFNVPGPVLALLALLVVVQAGQALASDRIAAEILAAFAFVPARLTASVDPAAVVARLAALARTDPGGEVDAARFFLGSGSPQPWTMLTYALLHGGWMHLLVNGVWLLAFGAPVSRRLGPIRFGVLFVAGALAGAVTHFAVDPVSLQPLVGASAAVSAFMGAALRFVFQPGMRGRTMPIEQGPRLPLRAILRDRRAAGFLAVWMVSNLVTGLAAVPLGVSDMPIAWQAHVGGFLLGLLLFPLFDPPAAATADPQGPAEPDESTDA